MPEYVRVADKETGHHLSITKRRYDAAPELWRELKSPATHPDGAPVAPKHKTSVSTEAAKKSTTSGQTADEKE
jgi:hypothetical protein